MVKRYQVVIGPLSVVLRRGRAQAIRTKAHSISLMLLSLLLAGCGIANSAQPLSHRSQPPLPDLTRYVDPLIGTAGDGNVSPAADVPFGMVQWGPDTSAGGLIKPGGYQYGDRIIRGFSLTHLSGAGCAAFGNVPFMPTVRPISVPPLPNGSPYSDRFRHDQEQALPGYYAVRLASGIRTRLTVTTRTGLGAFSFPAAPRATVLIDPANSAEATAGLPVRNTASVHISGQDTVIGSAGSGRFCNLSNRYTVYFAARFNRPFEGFGTWRGGVFAAGSRHSDGSTAGAYVQFDNRRQHTVLVKVGLSYLSARAALRNLNAENPGWNFATVQKAARTRWNRVLNRVQAAGGSPAKERVFYTALYHSLLFPSVFSDADGRYRGFDQRIHLARGYTQYANYSGWDIYRTQVPLLGWLAPRQASDMMQSLVSDARQDGWLPKWPVANATTGEMNGDSADAIIAGAYAFGARRFDAPAALRAMLKGASQPGYGLRGYQERPGLQDYLQLGYLRPVSGGWGSAATTLEFAVDDFAIAQLARSLGDRAAYSAYLRRAQNWRHLYNPATGYLEPRLPNHAFPPAFNPASVENYVEGNAAQYTWMAPHNLHGLFQVMGGKRAVIARLDQFFTHLNAGPNAPYYWAGNEPGLEIPWEYDFAGRPWRTQEVLRRIMRRFYLPTAAGIPGNDDLGTMSAWYVWAALGLYPEIPGVGGLVVGSPLFPRIVIHPAAARTLAISAPGAGRQHPYVQSLTLDGRPYNRTWLPLQALGPHTTLRFQLGATPNKAWASTPGDAPPSFPAP